MASPTTSEAGGFVSLVCSNPNPIETDAPETLISTTDIRAWDTSTIVRSRTLRIEAHRDALLERSSYFRGLLSGSFSDSGLNRALVQWDPETFVTVLKCLYGFEIEINFNNFLSLFEAALYFGVERLLSKIRIWASQVFSSSGPLLSGLQLDDLIEIWKFGVEQANDFVPELCVGYLARHFIWASSRETFGCIPHSMLLQCLKHPQLTIHSEMHLSEALLAWIDFARERLEVENNGDIYDILNQIRNCLLPLWFVAGKRRSGFFSELSNKSIENILKMVEDYPSGFIEYLEDNSLDQVTIRLTEYSQKLDISGCPQMTSGILLLSLVSSPCCVDLPSREIIKQLLIQCDGFTEDNREILRFLKPALSFGAVEEVDVSKCQRVDLCAMIECLNTSFPSLRRIKAAYLVNCKSVTLHKLLQKCSLLDEVDLTVDITPIIPTKVSVMSSDTAMNPRIQRKSIVSGNIYLARESYYARPPVSNLMRLTLEGRSDISDVDIQHLSQSCVSLCYINLKGCVSITDGGIACLIRACAQLHSILVCDTSFGRDSTLALCYMVTAFAPATIGEKSDSLATRYALQTLHIGGCRDVSQGSLVELMSRSQTLKSLCLRNTNLVDDALYNFYGSSLETLDVSNTMISGAALAHVVGRNPALKSLDLRDCKNLFFQEIKSNGIEDLSLYTPKGPYLALGDKCVLEELALGWRFSLVSFEDLNPAIVSLRKITVGLGGSMSEDSIRQLPKICPFLESVTLYFQVISDDLVRSTLSSLRHLQALSLCYCFGDISVLSFQVHAPNIRKLTLERVTPWMTNHDLRVLIQSCPNLVELAFLGCRLFNPESLHIISDGWPGLVSIHLEECGESTANGINSLLNCLALEDIKLRHTGRGIPRNVILDTASKMPMLRQLSLDLCDASEGDFDVPSYTDRYSLSIVTIARCKSQRCCSNIRLLEARRGAVHEETLVLAWNSENLFRTVIKERL